jgi:hypothetical protein
MQKLFHAACVLILAASLWSMSAQAPPLPAPDPKEQLLRFLASSGFAFVGERRILGDEIVIEVKAAACDRPYEVLLLPTIHRISDIAWSLIGQHQDVVMIHAGQTIGSFNPSTLIPRWLYQRALVNFQIKSEDPWISIALAVFTPQGCAYPPIRWANLSTF